MSWALDGGEWQALGPCCLTPGIHWIGGWVGPRAGLNIMEKRKICHCREPNSGRIARRYTDRAIPTPV
jgi:hypothetical protein